MSKLGMLQKKWLLLVHLIFSSIMLGGAVIFLVLSIVAASTADESVYSACYTVMHVLSQTSVRASTIGTIVTGVLLSVGTHWGLFRYYWVIAKEVLTLVAIVVGPIGMYMWTLPARADDLGVMWTGIILQVISLAAIFCLSVLKPWGKRKA